MSQINTQNANTVKVVGVKRIGEADVYNMEVQDNHNFSVNGGLIVHNCMDSMRYFVQTKRLMEVDNQYTSIFRR